MDAYHILVIILSVFLAIFLLISIVVAVLTILLIRKINRAVDEARLAVSNLSSLSSIIRNFSVPATVLGMIFRIFRNVKKR